MVCGFFAQKNPEIFNVPFDCAGSHKMRAPVSSDQKVSFERRAASVLGAM